jgi:pyruvate kinase
MTSAADDTTSESQPAVRQAATTRARRRRDLGPVGGAHLRAAVLAESKPGATASTAEPGRYRAADARKTKIIATLGPASSTAETIGAMIAAGLDVARLNFSHGDHPSHRKMLDFVRAAAREQDRAVAVLQDIQGPRIRVGTFPDGSVELIAGAKVKLLPGQGKGDAGRVFVQQLGAMRLKRGDRVLCADGMIVLTVVAPGEEVVTEVVTGGRLADHKGVAVPGVEVDLPAVTPKDEADLAFGREMGVDLVAASFVTKGDDIRRVRAVAGEVPVIAKIERAEAVTNLADILAEADGAMVARGDLEVELGFEPCPGSKRRSSPAPTMPVGSR